MLLIHLSWYEEKNNVYHSNSKKNTPQTYNVHPVQNPRVTLGREDYRVKSTTPSKVIVPPRHKEPPEVKEKEETLTRKSILNRNQGKNFYSCSKRWGGCIEI